MPEVADKSRKCGGLLRPLTSQLLGRLEEELASVHRRPWGVPRDGLAWVLEDLGVLDVHLALLPPAASPNDPLRQHRLEGLQLKVRCHGPGALTPQEKRELLLDSDSIRSLKLEPLPMET